ncbi:MAG TPA: hypothetical protein VFZ01_12485 [Geminicoccaceae bacterium]
MPARTTMTPLRTIFTGALLVLIGASTLLAWTALRDARVIGPDPTVERSAEVAPAPVLPRVRPPERSDFLPAWTTRPAAAERTRPAERPGNAGDGARAAGGAAPPRTA